jgi:hypothetical protein
MAAEIIGSRVRNGMMQTLVRLSRPLADQAPDWRTVILLRDPDGRQTMLLGAAYETNGKWVPVPKPHSWIAGFTPLTPRDQAMVEDEMSALADVMKLLRDA